MTRLALPLLLALGACSDAPEVGGTVQDIWGNPLSDATVKLEGVADLTATTDAAGQFTFELPEERAETAGPLRFLAEKEGYIPATAKVLTSEDPEAEVAPVALRLYKDPGAVGFHAIGEKEYLPLQQTTLKTTGSELGAYTGLSSDPGISVSSAGPQEFVFSSTASRSELSRLNLQLHRLEFKESASVVGATGATDVRVNLWLAEGQPIPFDLTVLDKENYYLLKPREALSPGNYAFHTQGMLANPDPSVLNNSPRELQVAYPFAVK